jgi:starch synthase
LNGIDHELLNPATDPHIAQNYDADSLEKRVANKLALQREASLPENAATPLIGVISRLTDQKGCDILGDVVDHLLDLDLQLVLLGTGDLHYHEMFSRIAQTYSEKAAVFLTFNAALEQRIYAGTDVFLMPSRFEPCGLSQMIAMRYGSVPVVRATGGLADTVKDFDPRTGEGNGFSFVPHDRWALYAAIVRALENYKHKDTWNKLQVQGMTADFSWGASAKKYVDVYYHALDVRGEEPVPGDYNAIKP